MLRPIPKVGRLSSALQSWSRECHDSRGSWGAAELWIRWVSDTFAFWYMSAPFTASDPQHCEIR
eukprot:4445229-Prymnesium_polylepis.1